MISRRRLVQLGSALLLTLPFLAATLLIGEFVIRMRKPRDLYLQPCIMWQSATYIQMYAPFCKSAMNVEGRTVEYQFNEHGLRDLPAKSFSHPTYMVLGDSIAKGLMVPLADTLAKQLERRTDGSVQFLNAGVRLSGPTTQSLLYGSLRNEYPLAGVILVVNGTDVADERLAAALALEHDENHVPLSFAKQKIGPINWRWTAKVQTSLGIESYLLGSIVSYFRYQAWRPLVSSAPIGTDVLCGGIRRIARETKVHKHPLAIVFTPHFAEGIENIWAGGKFEPADLQKMVNCAKETGAFVMDLSEVPPREEWFFDDRLHYRTAGLDWVTEQIANPMHSYFRIQAAKK